MKKTFITLFCLLMATAMFSQKSNYPQNGETLLNNCFGEGKYSGHAWIEFLIDDQSSTTDAIVCLVNVSSGEVIRNGYLRKGSKFRMEKIPGGTYYLKVYYGNDWNPEKKNFCGTKGAFESDEVFNKSDNQKDYITVENSAIGFTSASIILSTVNNGNMSTRQVDAPEFFRK